MRIDIKPMSVNMAWQGKRFKTPLYKKFERDVLLLLKPMDIPDGYLEIHFIFGFSNAGSDFDNPIKPFTDCLQKKYGFNDNRIKRAIIDIVMTDKGSEFIDFTIREFEYCHFKKKGKRT